jgi:hypothetical protein
MNAIDGGRIGIGPYIDPIWQHTSHAWTMDIGAMVGLFVLYSIVTWWRLVKLGPLKRG